MSMGSDVSLTKCLGDQMSRDQMSVGSDVSGPDVRLIKCPGPLVQGPDVQGPDAREPYIHGLFGVTPISRPKRFTTTRFFYF